MSQSSRSSRSETGPVEPLCANVTTWVEHVVRHEVPHVRVGVKGLHRPAVVAAGRWSPFTPTRTCGTSWRTTCSTQAVHRAFSSAKVPTALPAPSGPAAISTRNWSRTVRKNTFDLAPAGGPARLGVGQRDAEHRAGPPQCRVDEHRPVVDVELRGPTTGGQGDPERLPQGHRRLGVPPPSRDHRPGMIVEEGDQDRLPAGDPLTTLIVFRDSAAVAVLEAPNDHPDLPMSG